MCRLPGYVLGLALVVALGACATGDGMYSKLQDATSAYNRHLRWGDVDRAAEYMPTPSRTTFLGLHEDAREHLEIVDYEITRLQIDKQSGVAGSRAEVSWHTDERLVVEQTVIDQVWQWYEGGWVLVDERRAGGRPLAVFAEPEEDPHPYLPGLEAFRQSRGIGKEKERRLGRRAR